MYTSHSFEQNWRKLFTSTEQIKRVPRKCSFLVLLSQHSCTDITISKFSNKGNLFKDILFVYLFLYSGKPELFQVDTHMFFCKTKVFVYTYFF